MRTFGGEFSRKQKVSLAGTSRSVESREEILERSRLEREKRRKRKVENEKAVVIQSSWRSYASRRHAQSQIRKGWVAKFGEKGVFIDGSNVMTRECIGCIIAFADPEDLNDVELLARVCGLCSPKLFQSDTSVADQHILWVRELCQLSTRSLALHKGIFGSYLQQPFCRTDCHHDFEDRKEEIVQNLVGFLMTLFSRTGQGDTLSKIFNVSLMRTDLRKRVGGELVNYLFEDLSEIVQSTCETVCMDIDSRPCQNNRVVPCAEMLVTSCLVFYLSAQKDDCSKCRLLPIMSVAHIFTTCPSLMPLRTKLWCETMECVDNLHCSSDALKPYIVPKESMEHLLINLLQCLEVVPKSQNDLDTLKSIVPNRSLVVFMALVESILGDEAYWHISARSFVHPLAEANAVTILMNSLSSLGDLEKTRSKSNYAGLYEEDSDLVGIVCSFVARLLSYSNDPVIQTKLTLNLAIKVNMAGLLWNSYLRDNQAVIIAEESSEKWMTIMTLFCETFATALHVLGDESFYVRGFPLRLIDVYDTGHPKEGILHLLKECLWKIVWKEKRILHASSNAEQRTKFLKSGGKLLTLLHDRNGRRRFAPQEAFYSDHLPKENFHAAAVASIDRHEIEKMHQAISSEDTYDSDSEEIPHSSSKIVEILQYTYPLIPFLERVKIFQSIVQAERRNVGHDDSNFSSGLFFNHGMSQERFLTVHRGHVLDDAYQAIAQNKANIDVRKRVRIAFINEFGEHEAGIDGGGVFKEFLESVIKESTSINVGIFKSTMDNKLYPAPLESSTTAEHLRKIEFVGLMVGKALWEGILLELPLAPFFLKKFRGAQTDVDDLPSLDPEMAKNLQYLIENPSSLPELGLTFSITETIEGVPRDIELVRGGSSIAVTTSNVAHFLHRVANFKLNEQLKAPCEYFLRGFHAIIPKEWVASFNDAELQMLIGGVEGDLKLDLTDLENNVVYSGGYSSDHPVIHRFWRALHSMSNSQLADFLRFVTSCPRPPILGFSSLEPPLTIQMVTNEEADAGERLPTAATCVNLLKLPPYNNEKTLLKKLLYAIESHAGFDLS